MTLIAERIQERMNLAHTNPYALSKRAGFGGDYIRDIVRGRVKEPSSVRLAQLADALGTTADYLMGRTDDPVPGPRPIVGTRQLMREAVTAPIRMTVDADGLAHLQMDTKLPLEVAVQILALVKGKADE